MLKRNLNENRIPFEIVVDAVVMIATGVVDLIVGWFGLYCTWYSDYVFWKAMR
jgi:hypothetical protein